MPLKLIGAGFGRTGTESMKQALEILGLGPCHHMSELFAHPEQKAIWRAIAAGGEPDWDVVFAGYSSSLDWPSTYYWRELAAYYPEAKILLTVRGAKSWYDSMERTIVKVIGESTDQESLGLALIGNRVFGGRVHDRDHAIAIFEKNNADVQRAFDDSRLLTFHLGDGWEPLCRFLGVPIPDVPFPHTNTASEFVDTMRRANVLPRRK